MAVNKYEIHYLTIEKANATSSVHGYVSGSGQVISGNGVAVVSGRTDTTHTSHMQAHGRTYQLSKINSSYPFNPGDRVALVVIENASTGIYTVHGFANLTNGTRELMSISAIRKACVVYLALSVLLMLVYIGFLVAPLVLYGWIRFERNEAKWFTEINEKLKEAINEQSGDAGRVLATYSGAVKLDGKPA